MTSAFTIALLLQAAAKVECVAIEHEFSEYRAAQRSTPEADLARQLADANEQVRRAEAKAVKAAAAKQGYKEQVTCGTHALCFMHSLQMQPVCCWRS